MLAALIERVRSEPILVTALLTAILGLLAAFGLELTDAQVAAILALWGAVAAFIVRRKVTPNRKL